LEKFPQIGAMAADPRDGTIVLTDRHALLRWTPETNELERLAGSYYRPGFSGDGGPAKHATFNWPQGLTIDSHGNIFVADTENCRLRRIDAESGTVTTVAGGTTCQSKGDGQSAKAALLRNPGALAVDSQGTIFLSELCRVRRIDSQGIITTYAGTGVCGFKGDGGPAIDAMVQANGIAVDDNGNLYMSDYGNNRIRCVDGRSHAITTFAGNGLPKRRDSSM
jgi:sugar lactone lactonase YvrE